jgi:SseB protein C-terminal domain
MAKEHERLVAQAIRILGEQDGGVERDVKAKFAEFLTSSGATCRAYLARVKYEDPGEVSVALLIRLESGDSAAINAGLGAIFRKIFNQGQHLDIIFLTGSEEMRIQASVKPFFSSVPDR